jgi:hypothetical protein
MPEFLSDAEAAFLYQAFPESWREAIKAARSGEAACTSICNEKGKAIIRVFFIPEEVADVIEKRLCEHYGAEPEVTGDWEGVR